MTNIGAEAATRVEGLSAFEYIHQSIVEPLAFNAPECPFGPCVLGTMPASLADALSEEEREMIVTYLASLGHGG